MADMEVCEDPLETKKCFKCNYQLLDNLNVAYNSANSMFIFWNKYQLFLYENFNFEDVTRIFCPEFVVHQILISNNYLVCLDSSGNVHVTSLKFKNTAQKRLKTSFQPREQNIMACVQRGDHVLSLKMEDESYFLCFNKINTEFQKEKAIGIKYDNDNWPLSKTCQEKCLITSLKMPAHNEHVKQLFMFNNQDNDCKDYEIVIISLDKQEIFACLFSSNMTEKEIQLIKLYSCPSEICNMQFIEWDEVSLIVVLTSGSIIKLPLVKSSLEPTPIHLNTAVSKFVATKNTITYTDGISMWKTDETFDKIKFTQFFVRHVKDFVCFGDQMICTTYNNLIYLISVDDEMTYLKPEYDLFVPVEKLLNNSEYLLKLLEEVDKNNELIERVNEEGNYITALALSNRPDLMDSILENNVVVYEQYEDAIKENQDITLTEDLKEYFRTDSLFILVQIATVQMEYLVKEVLGQLFKSSRIHITMFTEDKLLKNNSIEIPKSLKQVNMLVPLNNKQISETCALSVSIKIVSYIPGSFNTKEPVWTTLYHKGIKLNSEQFIKTNIPSKNICLKENQEKIENLIAKAAENAHGDMFKFIDISNVKRKSHDFAAYVKLPENYSEIFQNQELFASRFSARKASYISEQLACEDFLKSKNCLIFEVGKFKVDVEIITDELSAPVLKVETDNVEIALNIRNFFAELIYNDFKACGPGTEFVDYGFYTAAENLQKSIKEAITNSESEEVQRLAKLFQKSIMGGLPI